MLDRCPMSRAIKSLFFIGARPTASPGREISIAGIPKHPVDRERKWPGLISDFLKNSFPPMPGWADSRAASQAVCSARMKRPRKRKSGRATPSDSSSSQVVSPFLTSRLAAIQSFLQMPRQCDSRSQSGSKQTLKTIPVAGLLQAQKGRDGKMVVKKQRGTQGPAIPAKNNGPSSVGRSR